MFEYINIVLIVVLYKQPVECRFSSHLGADPSRKSQERGFIYTNPP